MHHIITTIDIIQQFSVSFTNNFKISIDVNSCATVFPHMKNSIKCL